MQEKQEARVQSPGREDSLEKEMATHSSMLAWRIPWSEETGGLQLLEFQRVGHDWSNWTHTHTHIYVYIVCVCVVSCYSVWIGCFKKIKLCKRKDLIISDSHYSKGHPVSAGMFLQFILEVTCLQTYICIYTDWACTHTHTHTHINIHICVCVDIYPSIQLL